MGREHGTESTTERATGAVQPTGRLYLVGAPGVGKAKIAETVVERFDEQLSFYEDNFDSRYALSTVADYRVELALALDRYRREDATDLPTLFKHSLIDNLAYITFAFSRYEQGTVSIGTAERGFLTMTLLGAMMHDSFKYDHVFFVRGEFDPNEDYEQANIQACLQMILDQYQISYSVIDAGPNAAQEIGDIIEGYLGG